MAGQRSKRRYAFSTSFGHPLTPQLMKTLELRNGVDIPYLKGGHAFTFESKQRVNRVQKTLGGGIRNATRLERDVKKRRLQSEIIMQMTGNQEKEVENRLPISAAGETTRGVDDGWRIHNLQA